MFEHEDNLLQEARNTIDDFARQVWGKKSSKSFRSALGAVDRVANAMSDMWGGNGSAQKVGQACEIVGISPDEARRLIRVVEQSSGVEDFEEEAKKSLYLGASDIILI